MAPCACVWTDASSGRVRIVRCERLTFLSVRSSRRMASFREEGQPMPDSARGSTSDRERQSVEEPPISAKSRSGGRCSEEEKARVIRESFRTGKRVGEPPARSRHWGQERSSTAGTGRHRCCAVLRPDHRFPEKQGGIGDLRPREIFVFHRLQRITAARTTGHRVPRSRHGASACARP